MQNKNYDMTFDELLTNKVREALINQQNIWITGLSTMIAYRAPCFSESLTGGLLSGHCSGRKT